MNLLLNAFIAFRFPVDNAAHLGGFLSGIAIGLVLQVIYIALMCFLIVLIFRLVMDYVFQFARSWQPGKAMVVVLEATYTVTDPPLKLLRRFIPPLRLGGVALDLSFFVLMIIVYILISIVSRL